MEIPYTVSARPDTGLWNAKIGIWLFLASEVMLFGGLFSSYVYLRLGSDYPWPQGELNVPLGFVNTIILILSSVFVVFAWAELKMRNYNKYRIWMALVILCALVFLVNKSFEYKAKFSHKGVILKDQSALAGHLVGGTDATIKFTATHVTMDYSQGNERFLKYLDNRRDITFTDPKGNEVEVGRNWFKKNRTAGRLQSRADFLEGRAADAKGGELEGIEAEIKGIRERIDRKFPNFKSFEGATNMRLALNPPGAFSIDRSYVSSWDEKTLAFRDTSALEGTLQSASVKLEVDEIDLRVFLSPTRDDFEPKGVEDAAVFKYLPAEYLEEFRRHREAGLAQYEEKKAKLQQKHPGKEIREEPYRKFDQLKLKDLHHETGDAEAHAAAAADRHGIGGEGAEGEVDDAHHDHPQVEIPFEDIRFWSSFTPKRNTFYAIYFTMTGLHALHVLGGAIVLSFFLFRGGNLYRKNPEHLANRVEVGGLFWHFVDLVWIFLFPILYLM